MARASGTLLPRAPRDRGHEAGRRRIVEMMWEIIYADGRVSEFEENVIWRASDLLGISSRERIEIGRRIAAERAPSGNDR